MEKDNKKRLFEVMGRLDPTFKPKAELLTEWNFDKKKGEGKDEEEKETKKHEESETPKEEKAEHKGKKVWNFEKGKGAKKFEKKEDKESEEHEESETPEEEEEEHEEKKELDETKPKSKIPVNMIAKVGGKSSIKESGGHANFGSLGFLSKDDSSPTQWILASSLEIGDMIKLDEYGVVISQVIEKNPNGSIKIKIIKDDTMRIGDSGGKSQRGQEYIKNGNDKINPDDVIKPKSSTEKPVTEKFDKFSKASKKRLFEVMQRVAPNFKGTALNEGGWNLPDNVYDSDPHFNDPGNDDFSDWELNKYNNVILNSEHGGTYEIELEKLVPDEAEAEALYNEIKNGPMTDELHAKIDALVMEYLDTHALDMEWDYPEPDYPDPDDYDRGGDDGYGKYGYEGYGR